MKLRNFIIAIFLSSAMLSAHAALQGKEISSNKPRALQQEQHKTEINVANNTEEGVYLTAGRSLWRYIAPGDALQLYSEDEIDQVFIQLSTTWYDKTPFFSDFVPNHTNFKVKDYFPKENP